MPGPQDDYFSAEALAGFFEANYTLTAAADRMAYRFEGAAVAHARGHDIVSDGVALGAIQIAGDQAPFVLMADRQPTGGYPKLGNVILADIGRLAQMRRAKAADSATQGLMKPAPRWPLSTKRSRRRPCASGPSRGDNVSLAARTQSDRRRLQDGGER